MSKDYTVALVDQFSEFVNAKNELVASGICMLTGATYQEDYSQYLKLVSHVERLWETTCYLFRAGYYPQALFLAISCLEETGKIGVARDQICLRQISREGGVNSEVKGNIQRRGNPFYSHTKKHLLVAGAGAIVNHRLDRILGLDRVCEFLKAVRNGSVERLRQSALYSDLGTTGPIIPIEQIGLEQARVYVILAGELMAEILGLDPNEWERLLLRVQSFEKEIGHPWD